MTKLTPRQRLLLWELRNGFTAFVLYGGGAVLEKDGRAIKRVQARPFADC